jgi:ADP-dependent phosphofructokinase/glucokinase
LYCTEKGDENITTLENMEKLKDVINIQADIIYRLVASIENSKATGCGVVDEKLSEEMMEAAGKMLELAGL